MKILRNVGLLPVAKYLRTNSPRLLYFYPDPNYAGIAISLLGANNDRSGLACSVSGSRQKQQLTTGITL